MNWLDLLIILWLALALISGVKTGFIYKAGTTIGFFFGIWLASRLTPGIVEKFNLGVVTAVTIFLFILSLVSKLFGLAAWLADKTFKIIAIIPFLKTFNRLLGGILSLGLSCFILSAGLFVADNIAKEGELHDTIRNSGSAQSLLKLSVFYEPLLSDKLEDFVDKE